MKMTTSTSRCLKEMFWPLAASSAGDDSSKKRGRLEVCQNEQTLAKRKIPSEMGVAPLYNPFNPLIHNLLKNFNKFKTKKSNSYKPSTN